MLQKAIQLICLIFLLASCHKENKIERPADVLDENKMANVLVDIHLLEAAANVNLIQQNTVPVIDSVNSFNVYKKHDIKREQFENSFRYYTSEPEKLNAIYEMVINDLNRLQVKTVDNLPK